jgi:hypothetical protein
MCCATNAICGMQACGICSERYEMFLQRVICGLNCAPSEGTYSGSKPQIVMEKFKDRGGGVESRSS